MTLLMDSSLRAPRLDPICPFGPVIGADSNPTSDAIQAEMNTPLTTLTLWVEPVGVLGSSVHSVLLFL